MAKGLFGGMTDYSHQSFSDIIKDLIEERNRTVSFIDIIQQNINVLTTNEYWIKKVPNNFKSIVAYSLRHYATVISELNDINEDLQVEVSEHHVNRLKRIAIVAQEIDERIGSIWHNQYDYKEYGNDNFSLVEDIYSDTRDMAVNLLDFENIAERLNDFIGRRKQKMVKNNPWLSGSFYLMASIVILSALGVLSRAVPWYLFPIILIGGVLIISLVGIFQLRNDDRVSDKSFRSLIKETYKRLPLLNKIKKMKNNHP